MTIAAICQPNFLPWLGYFEMGHRADIYVMLDDVQYVRREWVNRNKILMRSDAGWQWIIIPLKKSSRETLIRDIEISYEQDWPERVMKTIEHMYAKAPYFTENAEPLRHILLQRHPRLVDLNMAVLRAMYRQLGISDNLIMASALDVAGTRDDKLAAICEKLRASVYLANNGSQSYITPSKFTERKIGFIFQNYEHPVYSTGPYPFQPYLSALDLLFWHGPASLDIILRGRAADWQRLSAGVERTCTHEESTEGD